MKKIILITSILVALLLAGSIWAYLFLFGAPQNTQQVFTNFGFGATPETQFPAETPRDTIDTATVDSSGNVQTLRQLTVRPVAGMTFIATSTVRYAEQGTGHIYDIDLITGIETPVSNTTFTKVREAVFAPNGSYVALTHTNNNTARVTVGTFEEGATDLASFNLIVGSGELSFSDDSTALFYILETATGAEGHRYDLIARTDQMQFQLSFGSVHAIWGDPTYIYTKPSADALGYVYRIAGGDVQFVTPGALGLSATDIAGGVVATYVQNDGSLASEAHIDADTYTMPLYALPEKCVAIDLAEADLLCGSPLTIPSNSTFPDDWYKGAISFNDMLWAVDVDLGEAVLWANPLRETGREIDVQRIVANNDASAFLFINKNDNALWLFEPTLR